MSAKPEIPAEDQVTVEINGRPCTARKGAMIIEVADEAGIPIPRFCYHKKLSIAANCRMCMVEVEKVPKPLPACATPVTDGMKIYTGSERARSAQKAVMEFLLINHPLDCPICDQGGECELQDLALGYGRDVSRFTERKRVVRDKNIGPLIATDMTRCIHCTRCIRMLSEVAGKMELGATGRGERMEIGTYIENSVDSELSGNVIDVCPVGALTSRPFRFTARSWEMMQHPAIAPHDSIGSNLYVHTRNGRVMRVVPRENEAINEVWLSDRDRYSYEGLYSEDRLQSPMIRVDGEWQTVEWGVALEFATEGLRRVRNAHGADQIGMLISPSATLEELFLFQALGRGIGTANIDHRLRQSDFSDQDQAPVYYGLGQSLEELEQVDAALLIGSNVRKEQPLAGHRIRKAALRGARIMFVNPIDYEFLFPVAGKSIVPPSRMVDRLAGIAASLLEMSATQVPASLQGLIDGASRDDTLQAIATALHEADSPTVLLGNTAAAHPQFALLKALAGVIADAAGARLGYLPEAANSAGASLAGALPHRGPGGTATDQRGMHAAEMIESPRHAYLLFGVEPDHDCLDSYRAGIAMDRADFIVSMTTHAGEGLRSSADVLLPVAPFTETAGTFVNAEGRWQGFAGVASPYAASRPGWKVLRVLGNLLDLEGFGFTSQEEIYDELNRLAGGLQTDNRTGDTDLELQSGDHALERTGDVPIYAVDALVRRASSLQQTSDAVSASARICSQQSERLGLAGADQVVVRQGEGSVTLPLLVDERVPEGSVWIPAALPGSAGLGPAIGPVELERA